MVLSGNPGGPGHSWLKKRYIDPAPPMRPHPDPNSGAYRIFIPSRLSDNPLLTQNDPSYAQRLKKSGPPWLVKAWLEGDWNATPEGGIVKGRWFQRYAKEPPPVHWLVQSWDSAQKPGELNSYSVCTTWAIQKSAYYLLDVYRARVDYPALKRAARSLAEKYHPKAILIEDKASGISLIQELQTESRLPVIGVQPEGDKVMRMVEQSATIESGRVFLPESAPWLLTYEAEMTIFPLTPHNDQVDSTSQFLRWITARSGGSWQFEAGRKRDI